MFKEIKKVRTPHHFLIDIMEDIKEIKLSDTSSIYYVHQDKIIFEFDFLMRNIWVHYDIWLRLQEEYISYITTRDIIKKIFKLYFDDNKLVFSSGDRNCEYSNNYIKLKLKHENYVEDSNIP